MFVKIYLGRLGETYVFSNVCVIIAAAKQMSLQGQKQFHLFKNGICRLPHSEISDLRLLTDDSHAVV